jgi:hypothetical protein
MNVLYAVRKSDETNQLLKNGQDNKNTCDAMDGITYVLNVISPYLLPYNIPFIWVHFFVFVIYYFTV